MPSLKKGMVVFHRSGIKGVIEKVVSSRTPFTNTPPELAEIHVRFENTLPDGSTKSIFQPDRIGSHIFFSQEKLKQAMFPINNKLNYISLIDKEKLLRKLGITCSTIEDWSNIFKFLNGHGLDYGFHDKDTIFLRRYNPKTLVDKYSLNPEFDDFDKRILSLKNEFKSAITYFFNILDDVLAKDIIICIVPSSSPNYKSGMFSLAKNLVENKRIDGIGCLVRHTKIDKLTHGGNRDIGVHLKSIKVANIHLIKNNEVLLLDDVLTSGNSLKACKELLTNSGAIKVRCLVLGKTHRK